MSVVPRWSSSEVSVKRESAVFIPGVRVAYGMTNSQQGALDLGVPASLDFSTKRDLMFHRCKMLSLYPLSGHCQLVTVIASYVYHKLDSQLPTLATLLLKRMCLVRPL